MRTFLSLWAILIICSCQPKQPSKFERAILGEWNLSSIKYIKTPTSGRSTSTFASMGDHAAYVFFDDKTCQNKRGYTKALDRYDYEKRRLVYLGFNTKYKISHDTLWIYNLEASAWSVQKIDSIGDDILILKIGKNLLASYKRPHYNINPEEHYDKIIVSSSGCYGFCPITNISIDKQGKVLFLGERHSTQDGLFTSNISSKGFNLIETAFKKANPLALEDTYEDTKTDGNTISVSFIKDNKIVKTITDYGQQAPSELIWAYTPVSFLHQYIAFKPIYPNQPKFDNIQSVGFKYKETICALKKSESFLLLTELYKGQVVTTSFEHKYKFQYRDRDYVLQSFYSDGRFYKFADRTIDIGYDFLAANNLMSEFKHYPMEYF